MLFVNMATYLLKRLVGSPFRALKTVLTLSLLYTLLLIFAFPYDTPQRDRLLFQLGRPFTPTPAAVDNWLVSSPALRPINWTTDVGIIVKTGYGTQARVQAWLDAARNVESEVLLVADFASKPGQEFWHQGKKLEVHDVVGGMVAEGSLSGKDLTRGRVSKYFRLDEAIKAGYSMRARLLSREFGWELDAMKFIPGVELAWKKMPDKKWYLLLDDDTYIVRPSLSLLLSRLDPNERHYIGNAIGGIYGRFAHGGSGVIISRGAMQHLFSPRNAKIVLAAKKESLTEVYGDRMLALAFLRVGIDITEKFTRYFNGERPLTTKIRTDRFCAPIFSFHQHAQPEDMRATGDMFREINTTVRWFDLWKMYGAPTLAGWAARPLAYGWDHVGRLDEYTYTAKRVMKAETCLEMCLRRGKECLAWTWVDRTEECHMSPWMIVGEIASDKITGVNFALAQKLAAECD